MVECDFCSLTEKGHKVFEDEKCAALLHPSPAAPGHLVVVPKEHFTIMEQVPDYVIAHMATIANKASVALFDALQAQGTNVVIANGTAAGQKSPHFAIHVIPRFPNDGLSFAWQPKRLSEDIMSSIELQLKEEAKTIGAFEKEKKEPIKEESADKIESSEEDYLIKQLRKLP
jgi:histidine triad (HIT) family protein